MFADDDKTGAPESEASSQSCGRRVTLWAARHFLLPLILEGHGGEQLPLPRWCSVRRQDAPRVGGVHVHVPNAAEHPNDRHDGVPVRVKEP
jgi:hypothetical protein